MTPADGLQDRRKIHPQSLAQPRQGREGDVHVLSFDSLEKPRGHTAPVGCFLLAPLSILAQTADVMGEPRLKSAIGRAPVLLSPIRSSSPRRHGLGDRNGQHVADTTTLATCATVLRLTVITESKRSSVLIVDDSDDIRLSLREILEEEGCVVAEAANGKLALDLLIVQDPLPSLIILDLAMPIMSGWELLAILKKDSRFSSIPVVICSGGAHHIDDEKRDTFVHYLKKPLDLNRLLRVVNKCAQLNTNSERATFPPPKADGSDV